jgi:transposase
MRDQARNGAPGAVQIADRFHVLMNVTTAMARIFERKHDTLKHIYEQEKALDPPVSSPVDTDSPAKPLSVSQQQQQARQARRQNRYDEVKKLHEQGVSQRAIAALVGLHRDTVHRYLQTAELPRWIEEAKDSGLPELRRFAEGLLRDYDAVRAALSFEYSQGQTEGQVHRLKLIKRQGYGRASFDLLRLRVLHGSGRPHHQKCV